MISLLKKKKKKAGMLSQVLISCADKESKAFNFAGRLSSLLIFIRSALKKRVLAEREERGRSFRVTVRAWCSRLHAIYDHQGGRLDSEVYTRLHSPFPLGECGNNKCDNKRKDKIYWNIGMCLGNLGKHICFNLHPHLVADFWFSPFFCVHFWCHLRSCIWKSSAPVDILLWLFCSHSRYISFLIEILVRKLSALCCNV